MIEIGAIKPSKYIAQRAKRCFVKRQAVDRFIVTPPEYPKPRRLITFELDGNKMLAKCENLYNGEPCPANYYGNLCTHVQKAIAHAEKLAQREGRIAA